MPQGLQICRKEPRDIISKRQYHKNCNSQQNPDKVKRYAFFILHLKNYFTKLTIYP